MFSSVLLIVHLEALGRRAHRLADAQAGVPEPLQKRGDRFLARDREALGFEQQQQVDIGIRKQLPAAVAAHGQQGEPRRGQAASLPRPG